MYSQRLEAVETFNPKLDFWTQVFKTIIMDRRQYHGRMSMSRTLSPPTYNKKEQAYSNKKYPNSTGIIRDPQQPNNGGWRGWSPPQRSWNRVRGNFAPSTKVCGRCHGRLQTLRPPSFGCYGSLRIPVLLGYFLLEYCCSFLLYVGWERVPGKLPPPWCWCHSLQRLFNGE